MLVLVVVLRVPKGFGGSSCAPPVPSSSPQSSCPWQGTLGSPSSLLCVLELGRRSGLDPPPPPWAASSHRLFVK